MPCHRAFRRCVAGVVACIVLAGCAVGPNYQRPTLDIGETYKEATDAPPGWKPVQRLDASTQAQWWLPFSDPELNRLMAALPQGNMDLAQAQAQYRQAQAALASTRAGFFPVVGASTGLSRSGQGARIDAGDNPSNTYSLSGTVSWEPDLWGKISRAAESDRAGVQASAADVAGVRLSMQSALAQTYFAVRVADAEIELLRRTVQEYERAFTMTQNRYAAGVAAPSDVAAATVQLENARTQLIRQGWQRAQQEHALAVLVGRVPSAFALAANAQVPQVPEIPVGVPSALLERRPDVAAAERRVAQANARIGVAQAAWFPDLTLSAQGGYRAGVWTQWLSAPALFWSLGPTLALTLFDGGARQAGMDAARAAHDAQTASYRQTVLNAMREVEDYLVQTHSMVREQQTQARALAAARETLRQVNDQYAAGIVDYLSVVQAQTSAFNAEQSALSLQAQRLAATVQLIAALGGGWGGLDIL
ncbi:efflux transporter outer membrane subunit [Alcaligenaceae bacterium CGII-47]|nr:efflux transporter outer membrane subunit [Alcaligenaceae bacterium CGII-47]